MRVTILLARSFTTLTKTSTFEAQLLVNKVRNAVRF